jgi:hypothetical protein
VEFERHSWVDVPIPFNLEVFTRRILLNLRSEDNVAEEIERVGMMGDPCLTQECSNFLHEHDCLVIINGLQSTHDWESIKASLLSKPTKGCILVITNKASVATDCAEEGGVINTEDMVADAMLHSMIKVCMRYAWLLVLATKVLVPHKKNIPRVVQKFSTGNR